MSCDEPGRAHLFGIGLLAFTVRDGSDVGSESFGEEQAKVSETTDADDADVLGGFTGAIGC
jgi:hypothetical protein